MGLGVAGKFKLKGRQVKITQEELRAALEAVSSANGGQLTPQLVVEAASEPSNPMYGEFEWDDATAANDHRCAVARSLIRQLHYVAYDSTPTPIDVPAYIHTPGERNQSYTSVADIVNDFDQKKRALVHELAACEGYIRRAQKLADVFEMRDWFDNALNEVVNLRDKVEKAIDKKKAKGNQPPPSKAKRRGGDENRPRA